MKIKLTELIDRVKNPRDKNLRKSLYIFLICCIISLFIWFLIKMSDEYVAEIRMPISYQNIQVNKLLVQADDHIYIRLRAKGADIFSAKYLSRSSPLKINLNQAETRKSRFFDKYYILTNTFRNQVSGRFDFAHAVLGIYPDTLYLNFEEIITRSLPVKARIDVSCKPQFLVYDSIRLVPEQVQISGPASMIDTMTFIPTERKSYSDLDQNLETFVSLDPGIKNSKVNLNLNRVRIVVPVEEFTESIIEVPVTGTAEDPDMTIRTFPRSVLVTYRVALKDYDLVKPEMFSLSVNYDEKRDIGKNLLKVKVDESPDFIRITRINPAKVEYLIQN
ncbi:MAG: hypothetical protein RQ761_00305 [Bacteroidales bacterium]|nr:hypothetical protein [Bacteroidales bacterium]